MTERENRESKTGLRHSVAVLALSPDPERTPWWARKLTYSHIVTVCGDVLWDQPIRGEGRAYDTLSWLAAAGGNRRYSVVRVETDDFHPQRWREAAKRIAGRKGQPVRTALRYLGLWPKPAWNCTSPVKELLGAYGIEVEGETPDDIIEALKH